MTALHYPDWIVFLLLLLSICIDIFNSSSPPSPDTFWAVTATVARILEFSDNGAGIYGLRPQSFYTYLSGMAGRDGQGPIFHIPS
jgi:hypothetical protein